MKQLAIYVLLPLAVLVAWMLLKITKRSPSGLKQYTLDREAALKVHPANMEHHQELISQSVHSAGVEVIRYSSKQEMPVYLCGRKPKDCPSFGVVFIEIKPEVAK
jgi:hypothetical protein